MGEDRPWWKYPSWRASLVVRWLQLRGQQTLLGDAFQVIQSGDCQGMDALSQVLDGLLDTYVGTAAFGFLARVGLGLGKGDATWDK
jgi:hypothetical protein